MKKILLFTFFLAAGILMQSCQNSTNESKVGTCCHNSSTKNVITHFASFAKFQSFRNLHQLSTQKVTLQNLGDMITFETSDGGTAQAYGIVAKNKSDKYLFVFHEWWGLNDHIKQEAEKLYQDLGGEVNVLAIDMYDGKVATNREDAGKYMQGVSQERMAAILQGAANYVGEGAKIATIGWCFGGGVSMQSSLLNTQKAVACVIYYGMPELEVTRLQNLNTDVLMIFATEDGWINQEVVDNFTKSMQEAGKFLEVRSFEAQHAFANPSSERYDQTDAEEAYKITLAYLQARL